MGPLTARTLRTQVGDSRWATTDVDVAHPLGVQRRKVCWRPALPLLGNVKCCRPSLSHDPGLLLPALRPWRTNEHLHRVLHEQVNHSLLTVVRDPKQTA